MSAVQRTFLAVKPDGVMRHLIPEIISRFERRGYIMVGAKLMRPTEELLNEHYEEHAGKPFLPGLVKFMSSAPVFAMVWEGVDIISEARAMIGATNPAAAAVGTIRKDFCQRPERNVIHGSDSVASAEREINLWFSKDELISYTPADNAYLFP